MRIGANMAQSAANVRTPNERGKHFSYINYSLEESLGNTAWTQRGSRVGSLAEAGEKEEGLMPDAEKAGGNADRSDAEKIYQAAVSGKRNPIENLRTVSKVPYGHLAKDGVILYNGVCFVCDEETNSICLGDMTDKENVLNIPLSEGGHLKVNRNSLGQLSRAVGMFTPEDLNLIMRAIAQDTKIQSVQKEIEDEEASVGTQMKSTGDVEESQTETDMKFDPDAERDLAEEREW